MKEVSKVNLYTIEADHAGKYASKLEQEWAVWFDAQSRKHFGSWDEHYIGISVIPAIMPISRLTE